MFLNKELIKYQIFARPSFCAVILTVIMLIYILYLAVEIHVCFKNKEFDIKYNMMSYLFVLYSVPVILNVMIIIHFVISENMLK